MKNFIPLLYAPAVLCYSLAAADSLDSVAAGINTTTNYINTLHGCGYASTTQAISQGAPVSAGSACSSADNAISQKLNLIASTLQSSVVALGQSRASIEASSAQVLSDFNTFASAFYALFNAMDLAECTYILTTGSQSFASQFTQSGNLKDSFNSLVAELSHDPTIGVQLVGTNFKQQTHFGGTSFLATQVDGPKFLALAGCKLITSIVVNEGGGTS